jgi:hypothetical protein
MRSLLLAALLSLAVAPTAAPPSPAAPTPAQARAIAAAVRSTWAYESDTSCCPRTPPLRLRRRIVATRVVGGRFATAAVDAYDRRGRPVSRSLVVVERDNPGWEPGRRDGWDVVVGPASDDFELACTGAMPAGARALLCPDPWLVLGVAQRIPAADPRPGSLPAGDAHRVRWREVLLPGSVCGATHPIRLRHGHALVSFAPGLWWGPVTVDVTPVVFGDLDGDGRDEAVLNVECANTGGMAAGQLRFAAVVYRTGPGRPQLLGVLRARQPLDLDGHHVPLVFAETIRRGAVTVHEFWYGPADATCCSTGRAVTTWRLHNGHMDPTRTVVLCRPVRRYSSSPPKPCRLR